MPKAKYTKCKGCGKKFKKSELSRAGYCKDCAMKHLIKVITHLHNKKGYYYRKWKKAYEKSYEKRRKAVEQLINKQGPIYEKWRRGLEAALSRLPS